MYRTLVYLHVVSAVASIGPFFLLYPLIGKLKKVSGERLDAYLSVFKHAIWFSKHSGHVLVTTGVLLLWLGPWSWGTSWVIATIVIMMSSLFFIARAFSPTIRKLREPHSEGDGKALIHKLSFNLNLYVILMLIMLWLMVAKPFLW